MPARKALVGVLAAGLVALAAPDLATAQSSVPTDHHAFTVSVMGGIGGSVDEDRAGYDNPALQLGLSVSTDSSVEVGARLGSLSFGSTDPLGNLLDVELTYATVAGEYGFGEPGYDSGLFLGIGVYRLEGTGRVTGAAVSTSKIGVTLGATGEFDLSRRLGLLVELSAHVLPSGEAQIFATGLAGLAIYIP